jgi:ABC-2 type transport system ATP-binding protein
MKDSMETTKVIVARGLTKVYDGITAVRDVSLEIETGETFGLLGPNGAGKTTLLSLLSGMLTPTLGSAEILGRDMKEHLNEVKSSIGIVFQGTSLDERLTGFENLELHAMLYAIPRGERHRRIRDIIELVGLTDKANAFVRTYSSGMKRRLEIARALLHQPKVLILDEPTLGLDPEARVNVWDHIKNLKGVTILLATNYVDEAEELCDRIGIIDSGILVKVGRTSELKSELGYFSVSIKTKFPEEVLSKLQSVNIAKYPRVMGGKIVFTMKRDYKGKLLSLLKTAPLESIDFRMVSLSDVFFYHVGKEIER